MRGILESSLQDGQSCVVAPSPHHRRVNLSHRTRPQVPIHRAEIRDLGFRHDIADVLSSYALNALQAGSLRLAGLGRPDLFQPFALDPDVILSSFPPS